MNRSTRYQGAIIDDGRLLLIRHRVHSTGRSYWVFPGGGIEPGESEEACVCREMLEETGLEVEVVRLLLDLPASQSDYYTRIKTYLCRVKGGRARPGFEPETEAARVYTIDQVGWFDLSDPSSWNPAVMDDPITFPQMQALQSALGYPVAQHPPNRINAASLAADLRQLGLRAGDTVMVHSAFKSLGITDPEVIIAALLEVLGEEGTLLMPALSYQQQPPLVHDTRQTPSCVGFLPEYFRKRAGTLRSLHPTHSVCGVGRRAGELLKDHFDDCTPCGWHSPFNKILHLPGKILMLGCGLKPNTTMHAIEEYVQPPYLFSAPRVYTLTDENGRTFEKQYIPHGFRDVVQRYDRITWLLDRPGLDIGKVGAALAHRIDCAALFPAALGALQRDLFYFVERREQA
ncbi:MAG TPA: AAC(3) family N-acetyltransferase [Anaerolineaceae bacterium]